MSNTWDINQLKINHELVMHREIQMISHEESCWYARMILPQATYQADTALFDRLANESLECLFLKARKLHVYHLCIMRLMPHPWKYGWLSESMHQH